MFIHRDVTARTLRCVSGELAWIPFGFRQNYVELLQFLGGLLRLIDVLCCLRRSLMGLFVNFMKRFYIPLGPFHVLFILKVHLGFSECLEVGYTIEKNCVSKGDDDVMFSDLYHIG